MSTVPTFTNTSAHYYAFIILDVNNIRPAPPPIETYGNFNIDPYRRRNTLILLSLCPNRKFETHFEHSATQKRVEVKDWGLECSEWKINRRTEDIDAKWRVKMRQTEDDYWQKQSVSQTCTLQGTLIYRLCSKSKQNTDYALLQKQILFW